MTDSEKLDLILKELAEIKVQLLKLYPIYVAWEESPERKHELDKVGKPKQNDWK